ncbi:MAG: hypothetical protein HYX36_01130 [Rhizobiales bacterium]|nr:hypothetical protein [Hyphomicrobiales bacterium]
MLWLNSALGLLFYFGSRAVTRSAWMQMKKPAWEVMPTLDVRQLPKKRLHKLAKRFDALSNEDLKPLAQLDSDPVRIEIDDAVSEALGIPSLASIRELLVREPGLTGAVHVPTEP